MLAIKLEKVHPGEKNDHSNSFSTMPRDKTFLSKDKPVVDQAVQKNDSAYNSSNPLKNLLVILSENNSSFKQTPVPSSLPQSSPMTCVMKHRKSIPIKTITIESKRSS